jgi:ERCC4-type nuclease
MLTLRNAGVFVEHSEDLADTIDWVLVTERWCAATDHTTLQPKAHKVVGAWGERANDHYRQQMLMGLPGVGAGLAKRILGSIGFPMKLTKDMTKVPGIGKKKLIRIQEIFEKDQ